MPTLEEAISTSRAEEVTPAGGVVVRAPPDRRRSPRGLLRWIERQSLFIVGVGAVGALSLQLVPDHLNQDGWLALVGGRYVAQHGIPHHDTLNVITHGAQWIDQQWLAQLALYGVQRVGGLALYGVVYVALGLAGLVMAITAGRRFGGTERHVVWVLPIAAFLYFAGSFQIRTQGFAYPVFVATLWLLADGARAPGRRRTYLVFPLLILWGNLHGSVTIGVALAMVYGLTLLVADLRSGAGSLPGRLRSVRLRSMAFLLVPALCLVATPYGLSIVSYYHQTILNPEFGKVVTEWQPVTTILVLAVPFFALACATVWLLGRSGSRTPLFDQLTLLLLAAAAIFTLRNITWFALAVTVLLPATISRVFSSGVLPARRPRLNLVLAGAGIALLLVSTIAVLVQPSSWFERGYDRRAAGIAAGLVLRHPDARVYADVHFSDWLLWHEPALSGRIAFDIRFELLTQHQLVALADVTQTPVSSSDDIVRPYSVLVLDPGNSSSTRILLDRGQTHVILRNNHVVVATRGLS
jgi:hypothetical protein